jgi:hypothetical protein
MKFRTPLIVAALSVFCAAQLSAQHSGPTLHSSRHFYAPTARTVPTDSIYLNWVGPLLDVNFGITDRFTAGIGTPLFTGVYVTGSYGDALNEAGTLNARAGALTGFPVIGGGYYSLPYGAITFGPAQSEITLAGGYFYMSNALQENLWGTQAEDMNPNSFVLNAGGYQQLNNRLGFAFEGWYLPQSQWSILMPGVRFYTQRNKRYWNVGIIRITYPELNNVGYWDNNNNVWVDIYVKNWQTLTLPMFSYATYL